MSTAAVVRELKDADQDFEWYPTTTAMIDRVVRDLVPRLDSHEWYQNQRCSRGGASAPPVLDIGAGDGRLLIAVREAAKAAPSRVKTPVMYAIEKSTIHQRTLARNGIATIGADFRQQSLCDKRVFAIFCNPPYSEYVDWVCRIISEASTVLAYIIVPLRWRENAKIKEALAGRKCRVESMGTFDFRGADRSADVEVELFKLRFETSSAFDSVVEGMLPELSVFAKTDRLPCPDEDPGKNLATDEGGTEIDRMVREYDRRLESLFENYRAACRLDLEILSELGITKQIILDSIHAKIKALKHRCWTRLFEELHTVRNRMATAQRKRFIESLNDKFSIDFTHDNIMAVLIWVSESANEYFDEQLIDLFRELSLSCCVLKYKSNERVWSKQHFRYKFYTEPGHPTHYKLEYRLVVEHGGIETSEYEYRRKEFYGLTQRAHDMLSDVLTVANNLGFVCHDRPEKYRWTSGTPVEFKGVNGEVLLKVRAYKKGTMWFQFAPRLMLAINVEAGRLLGWLRSATQAADEMQLTGDEIEQVKEVFASSFRISSESPVLMIGSSHV